MAEGDLAGGSLVAGRYRLLRPLGEGGLGTAWLVRDLANETTACLKLVTRPGEEQTRLLRLEFERLTRIVHPNLLRVRDYGLIAGSPPRAFFTSRFVQGHSLLEAATRLSDEALERALGRLAWALGALHAHGLCHGDVKPDNVLVEGPGNPTLIDLSAIAVFGASRDISGTLAYLAPERLRGEPFDGRADLYALGKVFRELADTREGGFADRLTALAVRLTDEDPRRRPATAEEVAETLHQRSDRQPVARVPAQLVGRGRDLAQIEAALAGRGSAGASVIVVAGPSGVGKTRLLKELRLLQQLAGVPQTDVFVGGARPVAAALERLSEQPVGDGVLAIAQALDALRGKPRALLLIDDLEMLSESDLGLVAALCSELDESAPLSVVATLDMGQLGPEGCLPFVLQDFVARRPPLLIELAPLTSADTVQWARDIGRTEQADLAHAASGGHPAELAAFFGNELRSDWRTDVTLLASLGDLSIGRRELLAVFAASTQPLPVEDLQASLPRASSQCATMERAGWLIERPEGYALRRPALRQPIAAALDLGPANRWLAQRAQLRARAAVSPLERAQWLAHQVVYHAAAHQLEPARQCLLEAHDLWEAAPSAWADCAPTLLPANSEALTEPVVVAICRALLAAGRPQQALQWLDAHGGVLAEPSLLRSEAQLALGDAAQAIAELPEGGDDLPHHPLRWLARARAQLRLGRYADAFRQAEQAVEIDTDAHSAALILQSAGIAASYTDRRELAQTWLERSASAMRRLGSSRDLSRTLSYLAIDAYRAGDARRAEPIYREALQIAEERRHVDLIARGSLNLATAYHASGKLGEALSTYERGAQVARLNGEGDLAVMLDMNLAKLFSDLGAFERACVRAEETMVLAIERGLDFFAAAAQSVRGDTLFWRGDIAAARDDYMAAQAIFKKLGATSEAYEEQLEICRCDLALSHVTVAQAALEELESSQLPDSLAARHALLRADYAALCGESVNAITHALRALECAGADRESEAGAHQRLANLRANEGDASEALRHQRAARRLWQELSAQLSEPLREAFLRHPKRELPTAPQPHIGEADSGEVLKLQRLLTIYRKLSREQDPEAVLSQALEAAVELAGAERGFVLLGTPEEPFRVARVHNINEATLGPDTENFSRDIAEKIVKSGDPVLTIDAQSDERFRESRSVHAMGLRSVLGVPIRSPEQVLGALYLDHRFGRARFGEADVRIMQAFADQLALALQNARLLAELRVRTHELEQERAKTELLLADQTQAIDRLAEQVSLQSQTLAHRYDYAAIIGSSPAMQQVFERLDRVVDAPVSVLISGESGTGKELVARAIHFNGDRKAKPFVGVNCGALPENLLESELFGHLRGAFSGADRDRRGLMTAADQGTLFLDEVGEMPLAMQVKLLRVLQEREVRPLGSDQAIPVDFRLLTATNRVLKEEVLAGRFREDLYFRIGVIEIEVPALRERETDILPLAQHFIGQAAESLGRSGPSLSNAAKRALLAYAFPGNVRELENIITRASVLCDGTTIEVADLGLGAGKRAKTKRPKPSEERAQLQRALEEYDWNVVAAANALGMPRATFYRKLKRMGLERP